MKPPASRYIVRCFLFLAVLLWPRLAIAYDKPVEKQVFTLPSFTTVGGDKLKSVRFGYEMYGHLNAAKDNAILILPYFSGTGQLPESSLKPINRRATGIASLDRASHSIRIGIALFREMA